MSKFLHGNAAARIATNTRRESGLILPTSSEIYLTSAPALAADAVNDDRPVAIAEHGKHSVESNSPRRREIWLLSVWLTVSVATIAGAAGIIAKYF